MKQQDRNYSSKFEEEMKKVFQEASNEVTSEKLDQSILAMAEKHHQPVEQFGFFERLFRSKQMKYLVSMSAALVMTVGIARFMVYLGQTDQGPAQSADLASAQTAKAMENNDFAFEMADEAVEVAAAPTSRQTLKAQKPEPVVVPELVTNDEMRQILAESDALAKVSAQKELPEEAAAQNIVVATGARLKRAEADSANQNHSGVMDEAIDMAPKPQEWLAEIQVLLQKSDKKQALEEWSQFKNTYPDYQIDESLLVKLKSMGLKE